MENSKKTGKATASAKKAAAEEADYSIEQKLIALYSLQQIDSQIDKIKTIRGELPMEVQDLEDDVACFETRVDKCNQELKNIEADIAQRKAAITDSKAQIKKYTEQQNKVRNNREFDSLSKEIEFQTLEIQLNEKKMKEANYLLDRKKDELATAKTNLSERKKDLQSKNGELDEITAETEKEEKQLLKHSKEQESMIEERLLTSYQRIRKNVRNGLAVVMVERDACGGCFNKIPPQIQMEIKLHKKIIICEYCGRVLVDESIKDAANIVLK